MNRHKSDHVSRALDLFYCSDPFKHTIEILAPIVNFDHSLVRTLYMGSLGSILNNNIVIWQCQHANGLN